MSECGHYNFGVEAQCSRVLNQDKTEVIGYAADIKVLCMDCGEPFEWRSPTGGLSPDRPTISLDGRELRAPMRPASSPESFGETVPGYNIVLKRGTEG